MFNCLNFLHVRMHKLYVFEFNFNSKTMIMMMMLLEFLMKKNVNPNCKENKISYILRFVSSINFQYKKMCWASQIGHQKK